MHNRKISPGGRPWKFVLAGAIAAAGWTGACAKISGPAESGDDAAALPPPAGPADAAAADRPVAQPDLASEPAPSPGPCVNLQCQQVACTGAPTSISGTAFAPNGTLPLYNVIVYVPNAPLEPFPSGVSCDRCGVLASGRPIAAAVSNEKGEFRLTNVPAGKNIPLVFQVGKWRRRVILPSVTACQDNPITDPNLTRLPRNRSEGDLPKIAVAGGDCDQLGCLLPKLGVDPAELGIPGDNKAVDFYSESDHGSTPGAAVFGPPNMPLATALWNDEARLAQYDLTLLSCECSELMSTKTPAAFAAMGRYLDKGGRIFGSHFAYVWFRNNPDPLFSAAASVVTGDSGVGKSPMSIDTNFPKGKALADWMKFLDPTITYGQIVSQQVFDDLAPVVRPAAQVWAMSPTSGEYVGHALPPGPRIVTINTPVGMPADKQCGRAAQLDAHIAMIASFVPADPTKTFPGVCSKTLSKGEEALAFLFFDLAACIQADSTPVAPPPVVIP